MFNGCQWGGSLAFFPEHPPSHPPVGVSGDGRDGDDCTDLVRDLHMAKSDGPWQNGHRLPGTTIKTMVHLVFVV